MKISEFKQILTGQTELNFLTPDGQTIPQHFHITEAGAITKHFVDCGGTERIEKVINFQIWIANDTEHRLAPLKLLKIIDIATPLFKNEDAEVEFEYQMETIGKFGVAYNNGTFQLTPKYTACLAQDQCGIPQEKIKVPLGEKAPASCCTPASGCCN